MTRSLIAAGLVLGLAVCAQAAEPEPPTATLPRPVISELVNPLAGFGSVFLGEVTSKIETDLAFPIAGTMAERRVDTGVLVAAGDVLALLDPTELDANVRSAEADVAVAEAELSSARDAADRARILFERKVDTAVDVEETQQALAAAEAKLEQTQAASASSHETRSYATMVAPTAAVVSAVYEDSGATLTAGQPVLRLSGTEAREVLIDVTEQQLLGVQTGDAFLLTLEANKAVTARATLASVDPVADSTTRTRRVHLRIEDPPAGFRLGALVRVTATAAGDFSRITLPESALRPDGTVWVVERPSGVAYAVSVTVGETSTGRVQITSGLKSGDEVVIRGVHSLKEGDVVGPQVTQ